MFYNELENNALKAYREDPLTESDNEDDSDNS